MSYSFVTRFRRMATLSAALTVLALVFSGVFFTPTADAQEMPPEFGSFTLVAPGAPCPAGTSFVNSFSDGNLCRPDGFIDVNTEALCATGGGLWVPASNVCISSVKSQFDPADCPAPTVAVQLGEALVCVEPLIVKGSGALPIFATPVCIEDPIVQDNADTETMQVGSVFRAEDGHNYLIVTGGTSCAFNCLGGFDANCDGKVGDFCRVEIDLSKVSGATQCLEEMKAAAAAAEAESVPVS